MSKIFTMLCFSILFIPLDTCTEERAFLFKPPSTTFVIVAHGNNINEDLLRHEIQNSTVVALDGASTYLDQKGIPYQVLLGDFDSVEQHKVRAAFDAISDESQSYMHSDRLIVPSKDQNYTDLEKGLKFCDEQGATKIIIYGASGDREDHSEWNRNLLKKYHKNRRPLVMRCACQTIVYITPQDCPYEFFGKARDKCGFFAYPETVKVTTQGLRWDVENWEVIFAQQTSVSNEMIGESATITIIEGPGLLVVQPNPIFCVSLLS